MTFAVLEKGKPMDENKLKPCPFCGGKAKVSFANSFFFLKKFQNRFVFAGCPKCGATTRLFNAYNHTGSPKRNEYNTERAFQKATDAWNMRAADEWNRRPQWMK